MNAHADLLLEERYEYEYWYPTTPVDFDWVTDRVATGGGIWGPSDVDTLVAAGVTHVICAARELDKTTTDLAGGRLTVLANGTDDDGVWKSPSWFGRTVRFALDALRDPNAKVFCHCAMGINRGPSAAYAVLRALGHSPTEAYRLIKAARPQAAIYYADSADAALDELGMPVRATRAAERRRPA